MLKYKLVEETPEYVTYRYYPEGREAYGEIRVDKSTAQFVDIQLSAEDEFQRYRFKLLKRIRLFISRGVFEASGTIAWY